MIKLVGGLVLSMAFFAEAVAWAQTALPEDVRQVLPGPIQAEAMPRLRQAESSPSASAVSAEEEPLEQMLERVERRYRSIVEEGKGLNWGTDTTDMEARLKRLEAFLNKLKEEAGRVGPKPAAPSESPVPVEKAPAVLPVPDVLPDPKDSASRAVVTSKADAVQNASLPAQKVSAAAPASAPVVPVLAAVPRAPKAVTAPTVSPASPATHLAATSEPLPWKTQHQVTIPQEGTSGDMELQEMAEQFQQLAIHCQKLSQELQNLADKLHKRAPVENLGPQPSVSR